MMKKRRIIAAVLILAFAFAFMAMTASARGVVCDECGSSNTTTTLVRTDVTSVYVGGCSSISSSHYHIVRTPVYQFKCNNCGEKYQYNGASTTTCG